MPRISRGESGEPTPESEPSPEQLHLQELLESAGISIKIAKSIVNDIHTASPRQKSWLEERLTQITGPDLSFTQKLFKKNLLKDWELQKQVY
jgi:hypothetical protein